MTDSFENFDVSENELKKTINDITSLYVQKIKDIANYDSNFPKKINKKIEKMVSKRIFLLNDYSKKIYNNLLTKLNKSKESNSLFKKEDIEQAKKQIENYFYKIVIKLRDFNQQQKFKLKNIHFVDTIDKFSKEIEKNKQEAIERFKKMEIHFANEDVIPKKYLDKSYLSKQKRESSLNNLIKNILSNSDAYIRINPINLKKEYFVGKAIFLIEKFINKQEKNYWSNEVKKVKFLNKRHKDYPEISFPKEAVVYIKNGVKYYTNNVTTNRVLSNINLQINYGEFVVILGASGSGKTTLLNIISGMDRISYGHVYSAKTNLIKLSNNELVTFRKNNIGYIFQQYGLLPNLTVRENIEIGMNLQDDKFKRLNIDMLLEDIGMYQYRDKFPAELSGGQQQRVSIARAIVKNPTIIFGDEPTGALDEEMTKAVLKQFLEVNDKYKTTLIIVTHNPDIAKIADKVIIMHDGKIKEIKENKIRKNIDEIFVN